MSTHLDAVDIGNTEPCTDEVPGHCDEGPDAGEMQRALRKILGRAKKDPASAFSPESLKTLWALRNGDREVYERTRDALKLLAVRMGELDKHLDKLDAAARKARREPRTSVSGNDPNSFRLAERGVEKRVDTEDGPEWRWVCSRLEVVAQTRDIDSKKWGRLVRITTADSRVHEWAMPMEMLGGDGSAYRSELLQHGLVIAPDRWARDALHEYLSTCQPDLRARCVDRIGWHGAAFVMPDITYGATDGERVVLQSATTSHAFRIRGDLQDWQQTVASYAVGNSRLGFAISTAFAAPLIGLVGTEGGGFNLKGSSSTGKSTALHVAASVWGGGEKPSYVRQWRVTANGLEGIAAVHCDALLCLDELGQIESSEAGSTAYLLVNGAGKSRAGRDGAARPPAEWRTQFLSTGEIGLAAKIQEDGRKKIAAGQQVRVVDVPADARAGLGVFEKLHGFANGDAFARYLKEAASKAYGTPIRKFLKLLVETADEVRDAVATFGKDFEAKHLPSGADGQVSRVMTRFGMVAFAGELATKFGILPWQNGEATRCVVACFEAWLGDRGGAGTLEAQSGIAQVRAFLEQHGESRFSPWGHGDQHNRPTINRAGFRRGNCDGGLDYFILPEAWKNEVCEGHDPGLVARALKERGHLIPEKNGVLQSRHNFPGLKRARCYHIRSSILAGDIA